MESQSLNTSPVHTHPGSKIDDQDQNHNVVRKRKTKNHQNSSRRHSAPGKKIPKCAEKRKISCVCKVANILEF